MNLDKYRLLAQIQDGSEHPDFPAGSMEGGDSLKWNGDKYYITGVWPYPSQLSFAIFYSRDEGKFCRHIDRGMTYNGFGSDYRSVSRDQRTGLIAGLIRQQSDHSIVAEQEIKDMVERHRGRWFLFADNSIHNGVDPTIAKWKLPDLTGPEIWAMQIRALRDVKLDKRLPLYDLQMLINTWIINRSKGNECISYLIKLFVSVEYKPTKVSRLSLRLVSTPVIKEKLESYWCGFRKQPEMVDIYFNKLCRLKEKEYAR